MAKDIKITIGINATTRIKWNLSVLIRALRSENHSYPMQGSTLRSIKTAPAHAKAIIDTKNDAIDT